MQLTVLQIRGRQSEKAVASCSALILGAIWDREGSIGMTQRLGMLLLKGVE